MSTSFNQPTDAMLKLLRLTGSSNPKESEAAMRAFAEALEIPLRSALLNGDILQGIFAPELLAPDATAEYPLDFLQSGNEDDYVAYQVPSVGAIPMRTIVGDAITIQTYDVANSIDWPIKYSRSARWPVIRRAMEVLEAGFVRKMNTDGFRTIVSAGAGRTDYAGGAPMVYDSSATAGQFTKRLVSLMKTVMTRLAGGNSTSRSRGILTDLYLSPEALEDIRNWDADEVDDLTRREILTASDEGGPLSGLYGVRFHPMSELGVGQEFQAFFDTLSLSMGTSDEEIVIGLDLTQNDSFVMPVKEQVSIYDDPGLHRSRRAGFYGWQEHGFGVLDARRVLLGSF